MLLQVFDKTLFRNGQKRNSPNWAFMEGFRVPHYDDPTKDYLWRLRIIATPWFGVFLHKLCTPDPRAVLHNHPWPFMSIVVKGGYTECVPSEIPGIYAQSKIVKRFNVKRFNNSYHWIDRLHKTPTWTLVFVGRRRRVWGYLEPDGTYTDFDKHPFNDEFMKAMNERYGGGDLV